MRWFACPCERQLPAIVVKDGVSLYGDMLLTGDRFITGNDPWVDGDDPRCYTCKRVLVTVASEMNVLNVFTLPNLRESDVLPTLPVEGQRQ